MIKHLTINSYKSITPSSINSFWFHFSIFSVSLFTQFNDDVECVDGASDFNLNFHHLQLLKGCQSTNQAEVCTSHQPVTIPTIVPAHIHLDIINNTLFNLRLLSIL